MNTYAAATSKPSSARPACVCRKGSDISRQISSGVCVQSGWQKIFGWRETLLPVVISLLLISRDRKETTMEQRLSILTLSVDDLVAMRDSYVEKFGWTPVAE